MQVYNPKQPEQQKTVYEVTTDEEDNYNILTPEQPSSPAFFVPMSPKYSPGEEPPASPYAPMSPKYSPDAPVDEEPESSTPSYRYHQQEPSSPALQNNLQYDEDIVEGHESCIPVPSMIKPGTIMMPRKTTYLPGTRRIDNRMICACCKHPIDNILFSYK